jgi:hypothetical protein
MATKIVFQAMKPKNLIFKLKKIVFQAQKPSKKILWGNFGNEGKILTV